MHSRSDPIGPQLGVLYERSQPHARGELVDTQSIVEALKIGKLKGYGSDVLDMEPPPPDHPLLRAPGALITPHIGSRTYESVIRQATMATQNLINVLNGEPALAQANEV